MSAIATAWAWAQTLPPEELLTLLALAEGANHQAQCWPAKAILQSLTSLGEADLMDALRSLESKGLLRRETQDGASARIFLVLQSAASVTQPARREVVPFVAPADLTSAMDQAVAVWNEMAKRTAAGHPDHRLAAVRKLNDAAKRKLAGRLKEFGVDGWRVCVESVEKNAHCRGVNDQKWRADFNYLLQPKGSMKAYNGGWPADYEERTHGGQRAGVGGRGDQRLDSLRGFDAAIRGRLAEGGRRQGGGA